jgi:replication initiation and membrane attachment protein DnaB
MAILLQLEPWIPKSFADYGMLGLILSNVLLWERFRRLEQRFEKQFEEIPKGANNSELQRSPDQNRPGRRRLGGG